MTRNSIETICAALARTRIGAGTRGSSRSRRLLVATDIPTAAMLRRFFAAGIQAVSRGRHGMPQPSMCRVHSAIRANGVNVYAGSNYVTDTGSVLALRCVWLGVRLPRPRRRAFSAQVDGDCSNQQTACRAVTAVEKHSRRRALAEAPPRAIRLDESRRHQSKRAESKIRPGSVRSQ